MHYYLDQHPEIAMARAKELNFFVARGTWAKGVDWYAAQFDAKAPVRGESSPAYTNYPFHDGVPGRMHSVVPDAKLVFVVRDPIERIVSQYLHAYSAGRVDGPIEEVLANGIATHPYVMRSRYYLQLEQYLRFFPREQILVLAQEDLLHDRARTMKHMFEFLEVDDAFYHPKFEQLKHRTSDDRRRKTRLGKAVVLAARGLTARFDPPRWIAWKAEKLLVFPLSQRIERPVVGGALRERLTAELAEDATRLREVTGKEFECWSL